MDVEPEFYKKMYFDLRNLSDEELKKHFFNYGLWEGRICNKRILKMKLVKNLKKVDKNMEILDIIMEKDEFKIEEKSINIVIRTHNRPIFFSKNINTIKDLNYSNYKIYISYENNNTLNYIKENTIDMDNIIVVKVQKTDTIAFYNDYCNTILDMIDEGYVMFLDDDDMFTHKNAFKYINRYLHEDRILCWEYLRADKIIGPIKGLIKKGKITSCGFCYHSKHKSKWDTVRGGDHIFIKKLIDDNKLNIGKIKNILTRAISLNIIYGEGLANDYFEIDDKIIKDIVNNIL
jgi:hypothetical protein